LEGEFESSLTPAGWTRDQIMKWDELEEEPCSLARTVAVIGDRWSLLILRECFLRTRRFEAFQSALGITRNLLAERLK
jgi:DNA-binding HxlR family transcriptional regulator